MTKVTRYTLFTIAAFFLVFAAWGANGFGYPSDPLDTAFNDVSKVICFIAAITMFLEEKGGLERDSPKPLNL